GSVVGGVAIIGGAISVERHGVQRRLDSRFELWKGRLKILKRSLIERWQGGALILIPALAALLSLGTFAAVAHSNDSRDERDAKASKLQIATLPRLSVTGTPRVGRHPFGVAIDSGHGIAVVANRNDRTVSVVDLLTATTVRTIAVGRGPVGVALHASSIAFVTLAQENAVAVIDPALGTLIRKIPVGLHPSGIAVGGDVVVIANEGGRSLTFLNAVRLTPIAD